MTTGNRNEKSLHSNSIKTINWLLKFKNYILIINIDTRIYICYKAVPLWIEITVMRLCRILETFCVSKNQS
jgi:hypothetical protein